MNRSAALLSLLLVTALGWAGLRLHLGARAAAPGEATVAERPAPPIPRADLWTFQPPPPAATPPRGADDVSFLLDAPAGKHGALRATPDGHLAFADGTRARFFGVNLADQAAFPDHTTAERLAARVARAGINLVRLTHLDASWGARSLFFTEKDKDRTAGTRQLSTESLDRLDYLLFQLRQRGVYVMITLLSARRFTEADGVADADSVFQGASLAGHFDRRLIDLQKEHAQALLRHRSRYTGKTLAEDPQLALLEIINEDSLFATDRYAERLPPRYREALYARVRALEPGADPRRRPLDPATRRALLRIERDYLGELRAHLRGLGVKAPIANSNWFDGLGPALLVDAEGDFLSRHGYWDHPQDGWTARDRFDNRSMLRHPLDSIIAHLAPQRVAGKPFVVVEWGLCWPNDYIAEGPLLMAAYASLQGWDGLLAFNLTAADYTDSLLGTGDHEVFDIGAKPHVFTQLPAAALLFHRGAVPPGPLQRRQVRAATLLAQPPREPGATGDAPGFFDVASLVDAHDALEQRLELTLLDDGDGGADSPAPAWRSRPVLQAPGLRWDAAAGVLTIETPSTVAVIGACQAQPRFNLTGLTLALRTAFCAVSVSALPEGPADPERPAGKPGDATLATARRLLITAAARAENTGMAFSSDRRRLRDPGRAPLRLQAVRGEIQLPALTNVTAAPLSVRPLNADGVPRAALAVPPNGADRVVLPGSDGRSLPAPPALSYEVRRPEGGARR